MKISPISKICGLLNLSYPLSIFIILCINLFNFQHKTINHAIKNNYPHRICYFNIKQTVWSGVDNFLTEFYNRKEGRSQANCFIALFDEMKKQAVEPVVYFKETPKN